MKLVVKVIWGLGLILIGTQASAATCGQLAGVKGPGVEILRMKAQADGERIRYAIKVAEGSVSPLECDDVVLAGRDSSARILLASAKLTLAADSRIELAAHTGADSSAATSNVTLINLTYGKMRALVQKKKTEPAAATAGKPAGKEPQANFRVRTFSAVAGVRGTDFYTSYDPNAGLTEQATIEGAVEVQQVGTAQKVLVEAGKQVGVETTPAAVQAAQERIKTGKDVGLEPPKQLPEASEKVKPLQVVAIRESTRNEIRIASAVAKDDKDFAHEKAVQVLGRPETWIFEREKVPEKLNKIKNEF
jgi:hypothetical protein